jgi:hypothetical protein
VRRGWAALEAAYSDNTLFLACGRPSAGDDSVVWPSTVHHADTGANGWDDDLLFNAAAGKWMGNDWQAADKESWFGPVVPIPLRPDSMPAPYPLLQVHPFPWMRV